jgi:superfamily II DNA or RNA helicase
VIADLAQAKPMDRVVCGDVGFGKTEVALRAAFAAVQAGKQVAVLVPTTLLAQQHFQTFPTVSRTGRSSRGSVALPHEAGQRSAEGPRDGRSTSWSRRTGCCRAT